MSIIASLIIPTHNRSASLKKLLKNLELQSYPLENFEVIVAADGCSDDTIEMVRHFKAGFNLILCELPGLGAASARNKGASVASGRYLIFADDDMDPSSNFIREHIGSHEKDKNVVIGYSPFGLESNASVQRMTLREWWEEKFQEMRKKGHRFKYDDLTSGNFSISSMLFEKLKGFDTTLLCREDYEFGFRLVKAGAEFRFAYKAKAFHCDEVTNLQRSFQRKKSEGMADIQIKKKHPDFINKEAVYYLSQRSFSKSILLKAIQFMPGLSDAAAGLATSFMHYFEKFKMRSSWLKMNYRLHQYWYLRGIMNTVSSSEELRQLMVVNEVLPEKNRQLTIDLQQGLKKIEEELDQLRPLAMDVYFGKKLIGTVHYEAGAESIKGVHLRKILKDNFSEQLASVLLP